MFSMKKGNVIIFSLFVLSKAFLLHNPCYPLSVSFAGLLLSSCCSFECMRWYLTTHCFYVFKRTADYLHSTTFCESFSSTRCCYLMLLLSVYWWLLRFFNGTSLPVITKTNQTSLLYLSKLQLFSPLALLLDAAVINFLWQMGEPEKELEKHPKMWGKK